MAKNAPYGDGHGQGQVTERLQVHNPHNDSWIREIRRMVSSWIRRRIRNRSRV